ncbi:hypothetical protein QBC33DRAFT_520534 [Phialemonium atrogriseum]|uniref:Nicotinamide-nucleotide adenylyltransferase n=1 Tax=Phialemonium atrogriseum TaxID=1093897 RepID=A0AAJ0CBJ5_9PEZI|nr:uncharacterized protein QBC33DRAFT_520534 [Phialemonium atrogriseum]KAK1772204.1 hypothetical protein QBC33DRAFT_520534 [Phialemonium atrogriseum]
MGNSRLQLGIMTEYNPAPDLAPHLWPDLPLNTTTIIAPPGINPLTTDLFRSIPPPSLPPTTTMASPTTPPSHRPILDFFSHALTSFHASTTSFEVISTFSPPARSGPQQLLQNRITAPGPSPPAPPAPTDATALIVLDSSFNPPTRAHLRMAVSAAREHRQKQKVPPRVLLVLGVSNADKEARPAALEQRLGMMWAFARDLRRGLDEDDGGGAEGVSVDICLSRQPYFHDKSEAIARSGFYGGGGDAGGPEQVVLVGYDTLVRIFDPKYYGSVSAAASAGPGEETPLRRALDPFFGRAVLRVTARADAEWGGRDEQAAYLEDLLKGDGLERIGGSKEWAKSIEIAEGRKEGEAIVSSTLARDAAKIRDGARLEELVTHGVKRWIDGEKLYTGDT